MGTFDMFHIGTSEPF